MRFAKDAMEIVQRISNMAAISQKAVREHLTLGLVPTMGALHAGHLSLVRQARSMADAVVVSIFVNPTQFGKNEDFDRYPRDLARDVDLLTPEGVDYVFAPAAEEMYPRDFATWVTVEGLSERLCGASRPGHFRGVATVVLKLFNIVRPTWAFFGQKDAQQSVLIRRMVQDLNLDTEIVVCPTVREPGGLAVSSRNQYLSADERQAATILIRALEEGARRIKAGERQGRRILAAVAEQMAREPRARIDYVELTDPHTLQPVDTVDRDVLLAAAVFIGKTRLIDNLVIPHAA